MGLGRYCLGAKGFLRFLALDCSPSSPQCFLDQPVRALPPDGLDYVEHCSQDRQSYRNRCPASPSRPRSAPAITSRCSLWKLNPGHGPQTEPNKLAWIIICRGGSSGHPMCCGTYVFSCPVRAACQTHPTNYKAHSHPKS